MGKELTDIEYLRDLARRIREIPAVYGTDGYDCDRLRRMSNEYESLAEVKKERDRYKDTVLGRAKNFRFPQMCQDCVLQGDINALVLLKSEYEDIAKFTKSKKEREK